MARTDDDRGDYILRKIPKPLWDAMKAKAEGNNPPLSYRWVIIVLLAKWVWGDQYVEMLEQSGAGWRSKRTGPDPSGKKPERLTRPRSAGRKPKRPAVQVPVVPSEDVPDLTNVF